MWLTPLELRDAPETKSRIKIVFLHIPKTAGSSLYEALSAGTSINFANGDMSDYERYMSLDLDDFDLISGHIQAPNLLRRDLSGWKMISILRDPIEREISTYRYIRSWPKHPHYERFKDSTFERFIEETADARNLQCRFFCGAPDADRAMDVIRKHFSLVGTTEMMPAFVDALEALTGRPVSTKRSNETKSDEVVELSDDYRKYLRRELAEDYWLYSSVGGCWLSDELHDPSLPVAL